MEISIEKTVLVAALSQVINAVNRRTDNAILSTVLLDAGEHGLSISAMDMDKEVISHIHSDELEVINAGSVCIAGHTLATFASRLRQGLVIISDNDGTARVTSGKASIDLPSMPASEFPRMSMPQMDHKGTMSAESLSWAIEQVSHAMSTDATRLCLNGINAHADGGRLVFVATDGHRLAKVTIDLPDGLLDVPPVIIPRGSIGIIQRLLSGVSGSDMISVSIDGDGTRASFEICGAVVVTKLVDATFPDYNRAIPSGADKVATFNKDDLSRSVKIVETASVDKGRAVKIDFDGNSSCSLSTHDADGRKCLDIIKACVFGSDHQSVGYNAGYMNDVLSASEGEDITLSFSDPGSPSIWQGSDGDSLFVIMPMRVN